MFRTYLRSNVCSTTSTRFPEELADTLERMFAEATSTGYSFDRRNDSTTDHRHRDATGDTRRNRGRDPGPGRRSGTSAHPQAHLAEREADRDPRDDPALGRHARVSAEHARDRGCRRPLVALE